MKIQILQGSIHSGKSTYLMEYCKQHKNTCGILTPTIDGKRHFLNIETQETKLMEAAENETEVLKIGKYIFSQKAFDWACSCIEEASKKNCEFLIIDEIGPLELQGKGFAETLKNILYLDKPEFNLLLVIRDNAVIEVVEYFKINKQNVRNWSRE